MTTSARNSDGSLHPIEPLPSSLGFTAEATGHGPYDWTAWRGARRIASGHARTRLGLAVALLRARLRTA